MKSARILGGSPSGLDFSGARQSSDIIIPHLHAFDSLFVYKPIVSALRGALIITIFV